MNYFAVERNMTDYFNVLKTNGVHTLKNFALDIGLFSTANWICDRYVDSIVTISSPIAGATMSLAINGADLLGKMISTRYKNNDLLGSALRVVVAGGSIIGSAAVTPSLAGHVGIEISKEMILRYGASAVLVQLLKNTVVPYVLKKVIPTEKNINYSTLTADQVAKYNDALIQKMAEFVAKNPDAANVKGIKDDINKAIQARAIAIKEKTDAVELAKTTAKAAVTAKRALDQANADLKKAGLAIKEQEEIVKAAKDDLENALAEDEATQATAQGKLAEANKALEEAQDKHRKASDHIAKTLKPAAETAEKAAQEASAKVASFEKK